MRYCQSCGRMVHGAVCRCKATATSERPPYYSRVYCRACSTVTRWHQTGYMLGPTPPVVYWECECGATRYQYADCTNVDTLCATIMEQNLRRTGSNLDHDEAHSRLVMEAWRLYLGWKPTQDPDRPPVNFEGYAYNILRRRANDIYRQMLGRNGEKPMANALSLSWGDEGDQDRSDLRPSSDDEESLSELRLAMEADELEEMMVT